MIFSHQIIYTNIASTIKIACDIFVQKCDILYLTDNKTITITIENNKIHPTSRNNRSIISNKL